jgi:cell division protein FtsB
MASKKTPPPRSASIRKWLILAVIAFLGAWLLFFDSYSLWNSVSWRRAHSRLEAENELLRRENASLEASIQRGLSDEVVERIAREQYGMRRPTETVYPVEVRK